jgi:hypothetical protein
LAKASQGNLTYISNLLIQKRTYPRPKYARLWLIFSESQRLVRVPLHGLNRD